MTIRKIEFSANFETSTVPTASDPVNPSDPVTLGYADKRYVKGTASVADNAALKALDVTDRLNGDLVMVRSTNNAYIYNSTSVLGDDTNYVLQPNAGSGRWHQVSDVDVTTKNVIYPNDIEIGNDATIHGNIQIDGDVNIDGTLTVINSTTIEVADANLLLNNGGTQAIANSNVAGVTIEMSDATDARIGYDSSLTSKWKAGEVGTESELIVASGAQTMTGAKTFTQDVTMQQSGVMTELGSTPATPSAGTRKIYATSTGFKQIDSAGLVSDLGGGGSGSGSGEVNAVTDTGAASGTWAASGAGVTVATTTTASEIPLSPISVSAIKMTPVSGTDYVRYRFTMPSSIKNTKLKLHWYQKPVSGYVSGDFKVEVYKNAASDYTGAYTEFPLSTDDSSGVSAIGNISGAFETTFDADSSDYYELRFVRVSGTTALVIEDVIVGPGIATKSAVMGEWEAISLTVGNLPVSSSSFFGKRETDTLILKGHCVASGAATGTISFTLPSGYTIDYTKLHTTAYAVLGAASMLDATPTGRHVGVALTNNTSTNQFLISGDDGADLWTIAVPVTWASGDRVELLDIKIPIAEWAGSAAVNLSRNDVEYAYNSSTTTATDTTSFAYGSGGQSIAAFAPAGTANVVKRVRFQTPISEDEFYALEIRDNNGGWASATDKGLSFSTNDAGTTYYGALLNPVNSTDVDVEFYSQGFPGVAWSALTVFKWRVVKRKKAQAVGFGIASDGFSGLIPYYNALTFTPAGDFTAGTVKVVRIGNVVTVTTGILSHGSNATPTNAAAIPTWARPFSTTHNVFNDGQSSFIGIMEINTSGDLIVRYYSGFGSPLAQTGSTFGMTMTYVI